MRKKPCVHFWVIVEPDGPTSSARCKECGQKRSFNNSFGKDEKLPFRYDAANQIVWYSKVKD